MKPPMNRKISGSAKAARASLGEVTPNSAARAGPSRAAAGNGIASVTHSNTVIAEIAASEWASSLSPGSGVSSKPKNTSGAAISPTLRRSASKRASASLTLPVLTCGGVYQRRVQTHGALPAPG